MTPLPASESLQRRLAPRSICFGCGPANQLGLQIASYAEDEFPGGAPPAWQPREGSVLPGSRLLASFRPRPEHQAFPGVLNGGIIGALLDCHCNWAGAYALLQQGRAELPSTVTAEYSIRLARPTPTDGELILDAQVTRIDGERVWVEGRIWIPALAKSGATATGLFVAVSPGHPAYHRW